MKSRIAALVLAGAAIALACTEDQPSAPQVSRSPDVRASQVQGPQRLSRTIDDIYADIAKVDSTFGGFFFDSRHVPVVYLTDMTRLASVRAAGLDAFLSGRRNLSGTFRVLPAAYGYGTLTRWYACARPRVLGLLDAVSTDIDEAHNRLRFGVAVASAIVDVQMIVTQCGIPPQAVAVEVVPRLELKYGWNDSLTGRVRPVRGGVRIAFKNTSPSPCTLGFVGRDASQGIFFTTAAHCSLNPYVLDPTKYWQSWFNSYSDSIGREFLDAPIIRHSNFDLCPVGNRCVFADVNVSHFGSSVSSMTAQVGVIARGTYISHDLNTPGSLDLDQAHHVFVTGVDTSGGAVGDIVCKTGQKSGTTCGAITFSCSDGRWNPHNAEDTTTVLCSSVADMHSDHGDSGSPVWDSSKSSSDSTVVLVGLLWGGPGYTTYYSTFGRIVDELHWDDNITVVADSPWVVDPVGLTAQVGGPATITQAGVHTWSAYADGGIGNYSYQWWYMEWGTSTWVPLGTGQTQDRYVDGQTLPFYIDVTITSGSQTQDSYIWVSWSSLSVGISAPIRMRPDVVCWATATAQAGTPPYTYDWSTGASGSSAQFMGGSISVTVTDADGTQAFASAYSEIDENTPSNCEY
jgi:hypothetical protein